MYSLHVDIHNNDNTISSLEKKTLVHEHCKLLTFISTSPKVIGVQNMRSLLSNGNPLLL